MVIGANSILMSDSAELGPLDVQLVKPDELVARMSGLTPSKALQTLREDAFACFEKTFLDIQRRSGYRITMRTAADIAVRLTAGLYEPMFGQIDPIRVAEVVRNNEIAQEYGRRLDRSSNLKKDGLERLISGYPSHDFIIDRTEATALFERVGEPTSDELELCRILEPLSTASLQLGKSYIKFLNPPNTGSVNPNSTRPIDSAIAEVPSDDQSVSNSASKPESRSARSRARRRS